jgi:hypothetical protein
MTEVMLFVSAFLTVFLLGFQQQNVHGRHYLLAMVTSLGIGATQIFIWRHIPVASMSEIVATLAGGPFGIAASMWFHPRLIAWRQSRMS